MAAAYGGISSAFSNPVQGNPAPTVAASPTNVVVDSQAGAGPGAFVVTWDPSTGPYSDSIYEYDVWVYDTDTPTVFSKIFPWKAWEYPVGTGGTLVVQGLTSGDHYDILVEPWNSSGPGKPTVVGTFVAP